MTHDRLRTGCRKFTTAIKSDGKNHRGVEEKIIPLLKLTLLLLRYISTSIFCTPIDFFLHFCGSMHEIIICSLLII